MNDTELIEMAAKAVGYEWRGISLIGKLTLQHLPTGERFYVPTVWNPLTNDGDAFHLAVALKMEIDHNHPADQQPWVGIRVRGCEGCFAPVDCVEDDFDEAERPSATRRAIVRAAAALGAAQQTQGV